MKQPQRFLKKVNDNRVFVYDEALAKRPDIVEITQSEAMWRLGKGEKPATVLDVSSLPENLVTILTKIPKEKMSAAIDALRLLATKAEVTAIQPPDITPDAETVNDITPEEVVTGAVSSVKDDPEEKIETLDKPLVKMNKAELIATGATMGIDLDVENPATGRLYTNDEMRAILNKAEKQLSQKE